MRVGLLKCSTQTIKPSARMVTRKERKRKREIVEEKKRIGTHRRQSGKAIHVCL